MKWKPTPLGSGYVHDSVSLVRTPELRHGFSPAGWFPERGNTGHHPCNNSFCKFNARQNPLCEPPCILSVHPGAHPSVRTPPNYQSPQLATCSCQAPVPAPDIDFDNALQELGNLQQDGPNKTLGLSFGLFGVPMDSWKSRHGTLWQPLHT